MDYEWDYELASVKAGESLDFLWVIVLEFLTEMA